MSAEGLRSGNSGLCAAYLLTLGQKVPEVSSSFKIPYLYACIVIPQFIAGS